MQKAPALSHRLNGHPLRRQLIDRARRVEAVNEDQDIKLFVLSFTAFFVCIYTFIF